MQNEQNQVDYLQTNQLQPKKKANKWLVIAVISIIFSMFIVGIVFYIKNQESGPSSTELGNDKVSLEQRFINNLQAGNAKALVEQNDLFQDKEEAVTTIDWLQAYVSLDNCSVEKKTEASEFNGQPYYQSILSCPLQTKNGKPDKNKRYMTLTFRDKSIVYMDIDEVTNKHAKVAELAEAFRW